MLKLSQVHPYQQAQKWSCSAACLKAVLGHWGTDITEEQAIEAIGAKPKGGAEVDQISKGARALGFYAVETKFKSLDAALEVLEKAPIVADVQSFKHPGKGHYVVLTGMKDGKVEVMDPNVEGNWRTLSIPELEERWWDWTMAKPHQVIRRWGVVVLPKSKTKTAMFASSRFKTEEQVLEEMRQKQPLKKRATMIKVSSPLSLAVSAAIADAYSRRR